MQTEVEMTPQEILEIEVTINDLEEAVTKKNNFIMLEQNEMFQKVILDGYMKDNAVRLVTLKGASQMSSKKSQRHLDDQIKAVGLLGEHFRAILAMGTTAEKRLEEYTEELANNRG